MCLTLFYFISYRLFLRSLETSLSIALDLLFSLQKYTHILTYKNDNDDGNMKMFFLALDTLKLKYIFFNAIICLKHFNNPLDATLGTVFVIEEKL